MVDSEVVSSVVLLLAALACWIILSFSQRRKSIFIDVCKSRPGIVPPINFLNPRHRLVYTLACAAQSSLWLNLLFASWNVETTDNKWTSLIVKAVLLVVMTMVVVLITYPVLACVEAPIPVIGYALGIIYSSLYLLMRLYSIFSIDFDMTDKAFLIGVFVAQFLPTIICMITIIIWYIYKLVKELRRIVLCGEFWKEAIFKQPPSLNHSNYVRSLLNSKNIHVQAKSSKISFHYSKIAIIPLPIMISGAVSAVIVFELLVITITRFPYISENFASSIESNDENSSTILNDVAQILHSLTAVFVIAPILSTMLSVALFIHMLYVVRKEIILLRKGESKYSPNVRKVKWPSLNLTSSVRYCGFQIASVITGWMFYSIVFFSIGLFFIGVYYIPDVFGYILYFIFISILLVVIAHVIEGLICKFICLTPESGRQDTIVINNRRFFNFFTYVVLLYNVATGLFTSINRLLMAFLCTVLLKPRLDRIMFITPFQLLDSGHSMYKSFLITEALLHNPVVYVFIQLLSGKGSVQKYKPAGYRFSQKARNRWFVAMTLLNNRGLIKDRNVANHCLKYDDSISSASEQDKFLEKKLICS